MESNSRFLQNNDPMYLKSLSRITWDGFRCFSFSNEFTITAEGYIPLVENSYNVLAALNRSFGRHISQSMFVHYSCVILYARCVEIKSYNEDINIEERQFLDQVNSKMFQLPLPIYSFLQSVGNITDYRGINYKLKFLAWPYEKSNEFAPGGSFGRVSAKTHWKYESMPSPLVTALRIQNDLAYTLDPSQTINWNLPFRLKPVIFENNDKQTFAELDDAGLPTKNLLGWAPLTILTSDQRILIESMKISIENFYTTFPQFQYNSDLMESVSFYINQIDKIKKNTFGRSSITGSLAQILFAERDLCKGEIFNRLVPYSEHETHVCSAVSLQNKLSLAALICSFRIKKCAVTSLHSYVCYDWKNYTQVPLAWVKNANTTFEFGQVKAWNEPSLCTSFSGKDQYRSKWINSCIMH